MRWPPSEQDIQLGRNRPAGPGDRGGPSHQDRRGGQGFNRDRGQGSYRGRGGQGYRGGQGNQRGRGGGHRGNDWREDRGVSILLPSLS